MLGTADAGQAADVLLDRGVTLRSWTPRARRAFLAATLTHLSETPGWPDDEAAVGEAVRRGTAAGALACTRFGAMRGLPTRQELERFMAAGALT